VLPRQPGFRSPWPWTTTWASALLYTLAFNVTFFIQELFLVVPKALTPGLRPTLYHNNHGWEGDHPLAELFQGTGALAILISAALCALALQRTRARPAVTLFLIWMTFHGSFQALLQVIVAAMNPRSDVGRASAYLNLDGSVTAVAALVALLTLPLLARGVTTQLLTLADTRDDVADTRARARFIARIATVPGVLAILPIIAFRVPRELAEVVLPPIVVTVVGMAGIQAWSWRGADVRTFGGAASLTVAYPLAAVLVLLLIFHTVLRPGIRFCWAR
jgi:hypothetical protein